VVEYRELLIAQIEAEFERSRDELDAVGLKSGLLDHDGENRRAN
jgi:hypothetical protein